MRENPVRKGATWVAAKSRFVSIIPAGVERLVEELLPLPDPVWVERYHFRGEEELTLRYLLVLDALNFCFWPPAGFPHCPGKERWVVLGPEGERLTGYYALSFALRRLALESPEFFSPDHLAGATEAEVREVLGEIPLPSWRAMALREVGQVLLRFGSAQNFLAQGRGSAARLVELLTAHLPMFRDAALYHGRWIPFYKRAQILVADLWGTFEGEGPGDFHDLPWLTAFADYKLPQILWDHGVLRLHPAFAERIRAGKHIPWGSSLEVEIRALTVVAVEKLVEKLREKGREILPCQVDWLLWNLAQSGLGVPHHRTLTWAY